MKTQHIQFSTSDFVSLRDLSWEDCMLIIHEAQKLKCVFEIEVSEDPEEAEYLRKSKANFLTFSK